MPIYKCQNNNKCVPINILGIISLLKNILFLRIFVHMAHTCTQNEDRGGRDVSYRPK